MTGLGFGLKRLSRFAVKDKNLANVRKGFRCKRLPQSRGSFAMTVRNGPYPQFPAKRVLTRNDKLGVDPSGWLWDAAEVDRGPPDAGEVEVGLERWGVVPDEKFRSTPCQAIC